MNQNVNTEHTFKNDGNELKRARSFESDCSNGHVQVRRDETAEGNEEVKEQIHLAFMVDCKHFLEIDCSCIILLHGDAWKQFQNMNQATLETVIVF